MLRAQWSSRSHICSCLLPRYNVILELPHSGDLYVLQFSVKRIEQLLVEHAGQADLSRLWLLCHHLELRLRQIPIRILVPSLQCRMRYLNVALHAELRLQLTAFHLHQHLSEVVIHRVLLLLPLLLSDATTATSSSSHQPKLVRWLLKML